MNMNTVVNKISILAVSFATAVALGLALTTKVNTPAQAAAPVTTIYSYNSSTNSGLTANVAESLNYVLNDSRDTKTYTLNVFTNTYSAGVNTTWLGSTTGGNDVLSGTSAGQFSYGSPTLTSLATATNTVTGVNYLYGIRLNFDFNFANYKTITVTFGWAAGATGTFGGFIAKSLTGASSESWSLLTAGAQSVNCAAASTLSFTDTGDTVLMGQSTARFALIFGSKLTKAQAMKNFTFQVDAALRTTLNSIDTPSFSKTYTQYATINWSEFSFTAHYTYPTSAPTVAGNASGVTLYSDSGYTTPFANPFSFDTIGDKTIYYKYVDPNSFGTAQNSYVLSISNRVLTGLEVIDSTPTQYKYALYAPSLIVYPLYDSASTHNPVDPAMTGYTMSLAANTMLTTVGDQTNTISYSTVSKDITVTVVTRTASSVSASGGTTSFYRGSAFALGSLVVTGHWSAGSNTTPAYASSQTDGQYTVSPAVGTTLDTTGTFTVTISYYVNSANVTTTYDITVSLELATFYTHTFSGARGAWGVTSTPAYGNLNVSDSLENDVDAGDPIDWTLKTTSDNPTSEEGIFVIGDADVRLGDETSNKGPRTISFETDYVVSNSSNAKTYNGLYKIGIRCETGTIGAITVKVAGISASRYDVDSGTPVDGSTAATTSDGTYHTYGFFMPYTVIGKVTISYSNVQTQPGYFDFIAFLMAGYELPVSNQTTVFGNMLNSSDSCLESTYTEFLPTYNYLNGNGATAGLSSITMTNHGSISASTLWGILVTRYSPPGVVDVVTDYLENQSPIPIIIISILGLSALGGYFYFNKRKSKSE